MDPNDFNFTIQSGMGGAVPQEPIDWDNAYSLMALVAFFTERAVLCAGRYVKVKQRNEIMGPDLILSMKYLALPSSNFWQTENLVEHCREWKQRLMEDDGEDTEEEEEEDDNQNSGESNNNTQTIFSPQISDEVFEAGVDRAHDAFEQWQPTDDMSRAVHRAIRHTELSFIAGELD